MHNSLYKTVTICGAFRGRLLNSPRYRPVSCLTKYNIQQSGVISRCRDARFDNRKMLEITELHDQAMREKQTTCINEHGDRVKYNRPIHPFFISPVQPMPFICLHLMRLHGAVLADANGAESLHIIVRKFNATSWLNQSR